MLKRINQSLGMPTVLQIFIETIHKTPSKIWSVHLTNTIPNTIYQETSIVKPNLVYFTFDDVRVDIGWSVLDCSLYKVESFVRVSLIIVQLGESGLILGHW